MRIQRTKDALPQFPPVAPAVHYATAVATAGNVEGWTADRALAAEFSEDVAKRVEAHYQGRPNVGKLLFLSDLEPVPVPVLEQPATVPEAVSPVPPPAPVPAPVPVPQQPTKQPARAGRK